MVVWLTVKCVWLISEVGCLMWLVGFLVICFVRLASWLFKEGKVGWWHWLDVCLGSRSGILLAPIPITAPTFPANLGRSSQRRSQQTWLKSGQQAGLQSSKQRHGGSGMKCFSCGFKTMLEHCIGRHEDSKHGATTLLTVQADTAGNVKMQFFYFSTMISKDLHSTFQDIIQYDNLCNFWVVYYRWYGRTFPQIKAHIDIEWIYESSRSPLHNFYEFNVPQQAPITKLS